MTRQPWPETLEAFTALVDPVVTVCPTLDEAASRFGVSRGSLEKVCARRGYDWQGRLSRGIRPLQMKETASDFSVPAWQGYKPRAGWTEPEKTPAAKKGASGDVKRWAIVTDVHAPFHDRKAWSLALSVIREWAPHRLVNLGDFMDTESVSRHGKNTPDTVRLAEEYHEANLRLDELQGAAPNATFLSLEGNHEARVSKWCNEFGSMDGMLNVPQSLYFAPRDEGYHRSSNLLRGGIWIPLSQQPYVIDDAALLHGVYENMHHASFTAIHLVPTTGARCAFYGHMHDEQEATAPSGAWAACCGFLGDRTQRVFTAYVKGKPKPWASGFRLVESSPGLITSTPVRIVNGRVLFGGRVVEARAA